MQDKILVSATVITDDETGCYDVGSLDFAVPCSTYDWLDQVPDRREKLAKHLEWLAMQCRTNNSPFESFSSREAVKKGDIRNTVLRQVKVLEKARRLLDQGRGIKEDEVGEFKRTNPVKTRKLKTQIKIITQGLRHLGEALKNLEKYKDTSTKTANNKPSFFKGTKYRLPTKDELIEINSCNLSLSELQQGLGYAIIGRGILRQQEKETLIESAEKLCNMFPDNKTYRKLLEFERNQPLFHH